MLGKSSLSNILAVLTEKARKISVTVFFLTHKMKGQIV